MAQGSHDDLDDVLESFHIEPDLFEWRFEPNYPVNKFDHYAEARENMGISDWKQWYLAEKQYNLHYYSDMEKVIQADNIEPIIVTEDNNSKVDSLLDGWHRVGAAFYLGLDTIPAMVGAEKQ